MHDTELLSFKSSVLVRVMMCDYSERQYDVVVTMRVLSNVARPKVNAVLSMGACGEQRRSSDP